jgi:protein-disulfide isomerase-like protein with CxxC motif
VPGQFSTDEFGLQWMTNAKGLKTGYYKTFTPANSSNSSAQIQSLNANGLPGILIQDNNKDGILLTAAWLMSHRRNRYMRLEATNCGGGKGALTTLRSIGNEIAEKSC